MYQENLQKSIDQYDKLKKQYDKEVSSEKFDYVRSAMSYDFLKARYIIETLSLFQEMGEGYRMHFTSAQGAMQTFLDIIQFKGQSQEILDNASYLESVIQLKDQINAVVENSPYLNSSLCVPSFGRLETITKDCLNEIPKYQALKTKQFRTMFIQSCMESLSHEDLDYLLSKKIISAHDLDVLPKQGSEKYESGYRHLCEITGRANDVVFSSKISLKGVTFDGRQEILENLRKAVIAGEKPYLEASIEPFTDKDGNTSPSIPVKWKDQTLGFVAKEKAKEIAEKAPGSFLAELVAVTGGGESSFGCEINLTGYVKKFEKSQEEVER